jgi:hypothetical protein
MSGLTAGGGGIRELLYTVAPGPVKVKRGDICLHESGGWY